MPGKGNSFITDYLLLILNNTNIAQLGDGVGIRQSTSPGNLYISLHTSTLSSTSTQSSGEANYTGYNRVSVPRSAGGWTVGQPNGQSAQNAAPITFGICQGGTSNVTDFAIGRDATGAGEILYWGVLNSNLSITLNITPQFATNAMTISES